MWLLQDKRRFTCTKEKQDKSPAVGERKINAMKANALSQCERKARFGQDELTVAQYFICFRYNIEMVDGCVGIFLAELRVPPER